MTYDDWKTTPPPDDEVAAEEEPDWDAINDERAEDRLTLRDELWYN